MYVSNCGVSDFLEKPAHRMLVEGEGEGNTCHVIFTWCVDLGWPPYHQPSRKLASGSIMLMFNNDLRQM